MSTLQIAWCFLLVVAIPRFASWTVERHHEGNLVMWIVKDFFPQNEITNLYNAMESSYWLFTTNVPGENVKVRSNDNISQRLDQAIAGRRNLLFAYAKYELDRNSSVFHTFETHFGDPSVTSAVAAIVGESELTLSPGMFVSKYERSHFLSVHADSQLGTYAFVLSLTKNWTRADGGLLRMYCNYTPDLIDSIPCRQLLPSFNSLVLFRVHPEIMPHDVSTVLSRSKKRYAVTGWYTSTKDEFSEADLEVRKLQTGNGAVGYAGPEL
jgi:hypothetical protein